MKDRMAKDTCLGCSKKLTNSTYSHQCTVCGLWIHKACSGISDEFFRYLEEQVKATGTAYWACKPCTSYAQSINRKVKEVEDRVVRLEGTSKDTQAGLASVEDRVSQLEAALKAAEAKIDAQTDHVSDRVFEEVRERDGRKLNIVIHGIPECPNTGAQGSEKLQWDKDSCRNIFAALRTGLTEADIRFCRRVGPPGEKKRPVVIGLYNEATRDLLLRKAKDLVNTPYKKVGIGPDLTKRQRVEENNLWAQAARRNQSLSEQERQKNLRWAVVGQRGEQRLILQVARPEQAGATRGRGRGRGASAPRPTRALAAHPAQPSLATPALLPPSTSTSGGWAPQQGEEDKETSKTSQEAPPREGAHTETEDSTEESDDELYGEETEPPPPGTRKRKARGQAGMPPLKR